MRIDPKGHSDAGRFVEIAFVEKGRASGLGKIRKITINPNSARKPELLTCTYGTSATVLAATEPTGTNSSTITFDFASAGIDSDDFRIDFTDTATNIEVGSVVIEYTK